MDSFVKAELVRRMLLYLYRSEEVLLSSRNRTILRYSLRNQAVHNNIRRVEIIIGFGYSKRSIRNRIGNNLKSDFYSKFVSRKETWDTDLSGKKIKNQFFHLRSGSVDRLPVTSIELKKKTLAEPVFHDKGGTSSNIGLGAVLRARHKVDVCTVRA